MLAILPLGVMAQSLKIGHVNSQEIISLMPDVEVMDKKIKTVMEEKIVLVNLHMDKMVKIM